MIRLRQISTLVALSALIATTACTGDPAGSSAEDAEPDAGDVAEDDADPASDGGDAEPDAGVDTAPDVEEPDADPADPDEQVDPSQWEDEFDLGEDETDLGGRADLMIGPSDRRAPVLLPDDYDETEELPVVFLFHGFTANAALQDAYFGLSDERHDRQFIMVAPQGHRDPAGQRYWNATDFCCDLYGEQPDDGAYFEQLLDALLEEVAADPDRVHLIGHSNGHFLSNTLACEYGSRLASFIGVSGGGHWDGAECSEDGTVSVLHIHGTADALVYYGGAVGLYPAAQTLALRWAQRNDCSSTSFIDGYTSLDALIWGRETTQRSYSGCPSGVDVELWSIVGGSHVPAWETDFADKVLDFALPRTNPDGAQ